VKTTIHKPQLVVITGRPASGKSTLAQIIKNNIRLPVLSRDEIKEGLLNTTVSFNEPDADSTNLQAYEAFFQLIEDYISKNISLIVEAAFQHKNWEPKLRLLSGKADIKVLVCKTDSDIANRRYKERYLDDSNRQKYHGDKSNFDNEKLSALFTENYEQLNMNFPMLEIETTDGYSPTIEKIVAFLSAKNNM
jgi:dephospho-CoA kinase